MDEIRYWIETEGTGHWFFMAFPIVLICLLIWFKGRRVRLLFPSLLISLVIINPLFYKYWDELGLYAYWRILWVVPVIPVIAVLVPSITEKIQKSWVKVVVAVAGVGLIIFGGTFLYNGAGGAFVEAASAAKLPDYVVRIVDRLLELDEQPRVIAQDPIAVYLRQYTGEINTLFGRDIQGYILSPSDEAKEINNQLIDGNTDSVAQFMLDEGYDYLIYHGDLENCFEKVDEVYGYGIFRAVGRASVIKERDELGRVISITTVDATGNLINCNRGYAKVSYEYDENNNVTYEFYTDIYGNGVGDQFGCAGHKRAYDSKGRIIQDIKLGTDGERTNGLLGYAEVRRTFRDNNLESESYYDSNGISTLHVGGFSSFKTFFDDKGNRVYREYYDLQGKPANRKDGYSKIVWARSDTDTVSAFFYNIKGDIINPDGINLVTDIIQDPDGWTIWIEPSLNALNSCPTIGFTNLASKNAGDAYTCQIEIEYRNVKATDGKNFHFLTQGSRDGKWEAGNIWNNRLIDLYEEIDDGIYTYTSTAYISEDMESISVFDIGFRCDYWSSGLFRVRNIKIECGTLVSDWSPGL